MKSGNGAPRNSKIFTGNKVSFGNGGNKGPGTTSGLPWVQGKGPGTAKPAKKKK
jgi:hypothetical protein